MSVDILVTGATGFVGANLVRALRADGSRVRVLVRPTSSMTALADCRMDVLRGDVLDASSLRHAVAGCRLVFQVAGDYRLWCRDSRELYQTNVDGTRHVLEACARAGTERVVYTSSVGTLGLPSDGGPGRETTPVTVRNMVGPYKRSKFLAERVAEDYAARGLPIVIVNPSNPIGPWEIKPTPTGQMIVDFLNRRIPAYVDTGLNLIDVRDVARGHLAAAERGRVGQKYILGNRNMTLKEILDTLAGMTGLPAPSVRLPHAIPLAVAAAATAFARLTGRPPRVSLESVRMSRHRMFFDAGKAVRELSLPQTPVEEALRRAVDWFRQFGYAPR